MEQRQKSVNDEISKLVEGHPVIAEFRSFLDRWGKSSAN
jgi:hypothetical protein